MTFVNDSDFTSLQKALAGQPGVRSFVIAHEDRIVFEHYRYDVDAQSPQDINSVTKTVVGLAVGAALRAGLLPPLDTPVCHLLPQMRLYGFDRRVQRITLRHLLTMTSGFEWDQGVIDECVLGPCERFSREGSRLRFVLARPIAQPGMRFEYDSHAMLLLSLVIESATKRTLECYVRDTLFAPLGIASCEWISDEDGHTFGGRGLTLRTRDMIKIGQLMLHRGVWRGARLIDATFIDEATAVHGDGGPPMDDAQYGYLCWIDPRYVFAAGYGEQFIFVAPRERIVAATTCDNDDTPKGVRELFARHVLGAS
ncbi:serine hydrolase (plasmid) [Caballeronia sp. NK8]|uniref:serine hydrolase domain-containing protein n=1 Tax=Caballeronia sp. NK8 TaxID=140098 RepID=UPI001BB4AC1B|nr:serine hydrolase [Caballeronia sp. NK8]BCQ28267.1 serine hydrolase [Caballeronia sp. NK8]